MSEQAKRKLCVVTSSALKEGWSRNFLERQLLTAGIYPQDIIWCTVSGIAATEYADVILALGEQALRALTPHEGIDKWQASVLLGLPTVIPCYPMERITADLSLQVWLSLCCQKAAKELRSPSQEPKYDFLLNPPLEQTMDLLSDILHGGQAVSVDIETGRGQINTLGFATGARRAVAIGVLPDRLSAVSYRQLWEICSSILQSDQPKILQNFIYEYAYFSRYGIRLNNVTHDTMICQKFLWPEFEMGLDAVGCMYTDMPYWKDDNKDWSNIRDWEKHYLYNCKDTAGTFAGYLGQRADLEKRGLTELHDNYLRKLFPCVAEMCSRGIPISEERLSALRTEVHTRYGKALGDLQSEVGASILNPRSPAQVKKFLSAKGYAIPKKYDSATKTYKESTDEKSLKKLRKKYPADTSLTHLLALSKLGKAESSYLNFTYDTDRRMRYSLIAVGTKTFRMAGYCDPWGHGVNPQTVPGGNKGINIKSVFECTPGNTFLQVDLKQAESRFVAYEAADLNLMNALNDPARDIHSEVAVEICTMLGVDPKAAKAAPDWKKRWRQLGKKSGHGANYDMKENTFIDSCIQDMDLVLTPSEANIILEAYHRLFPGVRGRHANIRKELAQTRFLRNPLGLERYFYGRLDDEMFRDAYAWAPQSSIPAIINHMMLHLRNQRADGKLDFRLLLQCHDSLLLECSPEQVDPIASICRDTDLWHPRIDLPGGRLVIPVSIEQGQNWGEMNESD